MAHDDEELKSLDLADYEAKVVAAIRAAMPGMVTVEFYRDDDAQDFPTPACILETSEFEGGEDDPGTGQVPLMMRLRAYIILSRENGPVEGEIRRAGLTLAAAVGKARFGSPCSPARLMWAGPDAFHPRASQFAVWATDWSHDIFVGENVWLGEDVPKTVYLGFAPDIGPGNEDKYIEVPNA